MCHGTRVSNPISRGGVPTIKDRNSQNSKLSNQCKLLCCRSCTFCNKKCKAAAKERLKSSIKESRNKVCELCFFCRSVCFCSICSQCPQCCSCSLSRRLPSALLPELGPSGGKSESGVNFEGGLFAPIQTQTPSCMIPPDSQWLCTPPEKHLLKGGYTNPVAQKGCRDGKGSIFSSLFQQTIHSSQTELEPKQIFEFVGYKYDLSQGLVQPTQNRWESILQKLESILSKPSCRVRKFMSLIGLLTATEKQVPLGRVVYEAKWSVFVRWCESSQVDFRSPSVRQIADFLLHLFQEKNLQPSTIDGYRSAIADKLGNSSLNVSKDENLTRLLDSFHRDRPKGRRGIPSWNLSLVLHQLTKPPFEPH